MSQNKKTLERVRRLAESQDFLQEVFVDFLNESMDLDARSDEDILRWMTAVARNNIRDAGRSRRARALDSFSKSFSIDTIKAPGRSPGSNIVLYTIYPDAVAPDRMAHSSLSWGGTRFDAALYGMTDGQPASLLPPAPSSRGGSAPRNAALRWSAAKGSAPRRSPRRLFGGPVV